jgi:hypothetical protein
MSSAYAKVCMNYASSSFWDFSHHMLHKVGWNLLLETLACARVNATLHKITKKGNLSLHQFQTTWTNRLGKNKFDLIEFLLRRVVILLLCKEWGGKTALFLLLKRVLSLCLCVEIPVYFRTHQMRASKRERHWCRALVFFLSRVLCRFPLNARAAEK